MLSEKKNKPEKILSDKESFFPTMQLKIEWHVWDKIRYMRDKSNCEIGGYGVSKHETDLFCINNFCLVPQTVSGASCSFKPEGIAEYLEDMAEGGWPPCECSRIWIHTHPGNAFVSGTDDENFYNVYKDCSWAVMLIVGKNDETLAYLWVKSLGYKIEIPVVIVDVVDSGWDKEYADNVEEERIFVLGSKQKDNRNHPVDFGWSDDDWAEWDKLMELEQTEDFYL